MLLSIFGDTFSKIYSFRYSLLEIKKIRYDHNFSQLSQKSENFPTFAQFYYSLT
jgi:hypothetical protein